MKKTAIKILGWSLVYLALLAGTMIAWGFTISTIKGHWSQFTVGYLALFVLILIGFPVWRVKSHLSVN